MLLLFIINAIFTDSEMSDLEYKFINACQSGDIDRVQYFLKGYDVLYDIL